MLSNKLLIAEKFKYMNRWENIIVPDLWQEPDRTQFDLVLTSA